MDAVGEAGAGRDGVGEPSGETTNDIDISLGDGLLEGEPPATAAGEEVTSGVSTGDASVLDAEGV